MINTKVKTKTVTNTQIAVATMAMFMAGGLAFAAAPAQNRAAAAQCVPFNINFRTTTTGVACPAGQFKVADVTCPNNQKSRAQYRDCKTQDFFREKANTFCANKQCANPELPQTGTLSLSIEKEYVGLRYDQYILAGERAILGRIRFNAGPTENVHIDKLALSVIPLDNQSNNGGIGATEMSNIIQRVGRVALYSQGRVNNFIASAPIDQNGNVIFENMNFQIPKNENLYLYVGVDRGETYGPESINRVPSFQIALSPQANLYRVRGLNSGENINPAIQNNARTVRADVIPFKITDIHSDFQGGQLVGGSQTLFSFSMTGTGGNNTDAIGDQVEASLKEMHMTLVTNINSLVANRASSTLQLCRIDSERCVPLHVSGITPINNGESFELSLASTNGWGYIDFSDFENDNDRMLESNERVEFVLRGILDPEENDFLQVKLNDIWEGKLIYEVYLDENPNHVVYIHNLRKDEPRDQDHPDLIGRSLVR